MSTPPTMTPDKSTKDHAADKPNPQQQQGQIDKSSPQQGGSTQEAPKADADKR